MDPNAVLQLLIAATAEGRNEDAAEHIAVLAYWIARDGFEPAWGTHQELRRAVLEHPSMRNFGTRTFSLTIDLEHFPSSPDFSMSAPTLAQSIQEVAHSIEQGELSGRVRDKNGNTCGTWSIKGFK